MRQPGGVASAARKQKSWQGKPKARQRAAYGKDQHQGWGEGLGGGGLLRKTGFLIDNSPSENELEINPTEEVRTASGVWRLLGQTRDAISKEKNRNMPWKRWHRLQQLSGGGKSGRCSSNAARRTPADAHARPSKPLLLTGRLRGTAEQPPEEHPPGISPPSVVRPVLLSSTKRAWA